MLIINDRRTNKIFLKQGEVKSVAFVYNVDLIGATFFFGVKQKKSDTSYILSVDDADFDKSEIADMTAKMILNTSTLDDNRKYFGELKVTWLSSSIDKTEDIILIIEEPVIT
jgi:hypothetical protein